MPELPEVETVVRELRKKLAGRKLVRLKTFDKRLGYPRFSLPLKITGVGRHGKFIVFHADKGRILLHLRMTGRLFIKKEQLRAALLLPPEKHERARFLFSGGITLRFFDPRRFGTIEWRKEGLPELGADPLGKEFAAANFKDILSWHSRAVRGLLLDQKIIAGLGTIYADESLWLAKIDPRRKSNSLSGAETKRLTASIKEVLRLAIRKGGTTLRDYRKTGGDKGSYQFFRKAYGREGLPCFRCRGRIKRIKIGGRSARFCPKCQR